MPLAAMRQRKGGQGVSGSISPYVGCVLRCVQEQRTILQGLATDGLKFCEGGVAVRLLGEEMFQMDLTESRALGRGYVHVYTGNGKGKTTAALGLAFRAMGRGLKTYVGQFMKGQRYGELEAAKQASSYITIEQYGADTMVHVQDPPLEEDVQRAREGLARAKEAMLSGDYDIVVFDEIITSHAYRLISIEDMLEIIAAKPEGVEVVLTGRYAPPELIDAADLVTEMVEVKHYYQKGVQARDGIER